MVIRQEKKKRKYFGSRSWGAGNIKNRRGAGDRGGVGKGGRKHKFTHIVVYEKYNVGRKGFTHWGEKKLKEMDLQGVSKLAIKSGESRPTLELRGYKVLGDGNMEKSAIVKASGFSKRAIEKIKKSGGEAVVFGEAVHEDKEA
ncbi:MAG: uL15m family ribosomal protein [Candidatus Micrarchaeia archaeon]